METYPADEDGEVLSMLARRGVDMTKPLRIEFEVFAPNASAAETIVERLTEAGYQPRIEHDEGEPHDETNPDEVEEFGPSWTVVVDKVMTPAHAEIVRIQQDLERISVPHGGYSDGWGVLIDPAAQ